MKKEWFEQLDVRLQQVWTEMLSSSPTIKAFADRSCTRELLGILLLEICQYTQHNSRNQALVALRSLGVSHSYAQYCFKHAREEVGHEELALHDFAALGFPVPERSLLKPLAETETLIAYLYWVSEQGNPLRRLGYSYWAERCYSYIGPVIRDIKQCFGLVDRQMTFFASHATIDEKHAREVMDIIASTCASQQDVHDIATSWRRACA